MSVAGTCEKSVGFRKDQVNQIISKLKRGKAGGIRKETQISFSSCTFPKPTPYVYCNLNQSQNFWVCNMQLPLACMLCCSKFVSSVMLQAFLVAKAWEETHT